MRRFGLIGPGVLLSVFSAGVYAGSAAVPDKGDTGWLIVATTMVMLMSIPGVALFYGGMVRSKNMLSVLMQVFVVFCLISLLWVIYGYSLAFTEGNAFLGGFSKAFLSGVTAEAVTGTFSKGVVIPEFVYVAFQGAFAAITCCLIVGGFAERIRFSAVLLFSAIWFTLAYLPIAHMVWYWAGPDAYTDAQAAAAANSTAGWLFREGALDFAGGTVVHINAAIAALVGAYLVGPRLGYGRESMPPHNLMATMIGACLLWFGWAGFNAGSALEAGGTAALALVNTWVATSAATLSWAGAERIFKGKSSMLGAASGAISGLVAITPACGFVGTAGALIIGLLAGVACLWGVNGLKRLLKADDSLDVFGVHGVGGILGALMTGVFAAPVLGGAGIFDYVDNRVADDYAIFSQVLVQTTGVLVTIVWSALIAFVAFKIIDQFIGLRVSIEHEREGLDITTHGESAYNR